MVLEGGGGDFGGCRVGWNGLRKTAKGKGKGKGNVRMLEERNRDKGRLGGVVATAVVSSGSGSAAVMMGKRMKMGWQTRVGCCLVCGRKKKMEEAS